MIITIKPAIPEAEVLVDPRTPPPYGWTSLSLAKMMVAINPGLATERDKLKIALMLRDQVYHHCPMVPTRGGVNWLDFYGEYAACVRDRVYGHECQGRSTLFLIACKAFGIQARYVGLWSAITNLGASTFVHASAEVFINGKWIGMDAHYNRSLKNANGERIGYREAQLILKDEGIVNLDYDGYVGIPNLTPEHYLQNVYSMTFKQLMSYILVGVHGGSLSAVPYAMNGSWNGQLHYAGGTMFDALAMAQAPHYMALI